MPFTHVPADDWALQQCIPRATLQSVRILPGYLVATLSIERTRDQAYATLINAAKGFTLSSLVEKGDFAILDANRSSMYNAPPKAGKKVRVKETDLDAGIL
jgi:hypothetical protein